MKKLLVAGAVATLAIASQAQAAANLTYAAVYGQDNASGVSGATLGIWSAGTGASNDNWTLFLSKATTGGTALQNTGALNKGLNVATTAGVNNFTLNADSYVNQSGNTQNSSNTYRLFLGFADGAAIQADYNVVTNAFSNATTATVGGTTYAFTNSGFQFTRGGGDTVGMYTFGPNSNAPDYTGQISFTTTAVPEPATWAMMMVGFGMIGAVARRRRAAVKVTYA